MFLILLLFCHYLADFCLTWPDLIQAKANARHLWPILLHASVHAVLMGLCLLMFGVGIGKMAWLVLFEWATHFAIDTAKARLSAVNPLLADLKHKPYWMLFGLDQLLHQVVVIVIWYFSMSH